MQNWQPGKSFPYSLLDKLLRELARDNKHRTQVDFFFFKSKATFEDQTKLKYIYTRNISQGTSNYPNNPSIKILYLSWHYFSSLHGQSLETALLISLMWATVEISWCLRIQGVLKVQQLNQREVRQILNVWK